MKKGMKRKMTETERMIGKFDEKTMKIFLKQNVNMINMMDLKILC